MPSLNAVVAAIDDEIRKRTSPLFGIKFGAELYRDLAKAGKIRWAKASFEGTGAFPLEMPAYEGKYAAWSDWELGEYEFQVGVPKD